MKTMEFNTRSSMIRYLESRYGEDVKLWGGGVWANKHYQVGFFKYNGDTEIYTLTLR